MSLRSSRAIGATPSRLTASSALNAGLIERTFNPGFRIELHQKDLNLALQGARALGMSLPNTATCQELFNACAAHGWKGLDHSAMIRALEGMADHEVGSPK